MPHEEKVVLSILQVFMFFLLVTASCHSLDEVSLQVLHLLDLDSDADRLELLFLDLEVTLEHIPLLFLVSVDHLGPGLGLIFHHGYHVRVTVVVPARKWIVLGITDKVSLSNKPGTYVT